MSEQQWKLVPNLPTEKMREAYEKCSVAPMGALSRNGYAAAIAAAPQPPALGGLRIVCDRMPDSDGCRFVEVEDASGKSVRAGEWRSRSDGYAELVLHCPPAFGGEPEVIYMLRNTALNTPWRDADKAAFDSASGLVEYERRELVDRAHVARLRSERDDIQRQFDELAERWAKLVTDEDGKFMRVCGERDKALAEVERLTHERDCLGKAIGDAALKAGIVREGAGLTGPMLLMLSDDLAECQKSSEARTAELEGLLRDTSKAIVTHQAEQPMSHRLSRKLTAARTKIKAALAEGAKS